MPNDWPKLALALGGATLILAVLAGFGVWILYLDRQAKRQWAAVQLWPATPGRLLSAELGHSESRMPDRNTVTSYGLAVRYEYEVAGHSLVGSQVTLEGVSGYEASQRFLAQHPAGSEVTVYYDPANPQHTYLDRSAPSSSRGFGLLFIGIAVMGGCMLCLAASTVLLSG